tara:strand:+ start:16 stop:636 length:621 start_codon:yes stop_codon:yes gene_type:complete
MKKLLILLFSLSFLSSPSVYADDISDFQIEGISIGDSLLDYMDEEEILKGIEVYKGYEFLKEPNKYSQIDLLTKSSTYYGKSFFIKNTTANKYISNNNKKYTIKGVIGFIEFIEDFDGCIQKSNEIFEILTEMFPNEESQEYRQNHAGDRSGNSNENVVMIWFDSNAAISIKCIDLEETYRKENDWSEGLHLAVLSNEIANWLSDY